MWRWASALAVAAAVGGSTACESASHELFVDVKTDLVAGVEFTSVRVELFDGVPRPSDRAGGRRARAHVAAGGRAWLASERVAEIGGLAARTYWVRIELRDGLERSVASRLATVSVRGNVVVTVVITRDCIDVICPGPGDDPARTACFGGTCVEPSCTVESSAACGEAECRTSTDCSSPPAPCADAACVDGACLALAREGACSDDAWCDPERGCTRLRGEPVVDAGLLDAGGSPPDAGPADGGPTDSGTGTCGFATCRGDGTTCGTCGDGSDGAYAPAASGMLTAGVQHFASVNIPAGVAITVTGMQPLRILSRGPVVIDGTLDLSGGPGERTICSGLPPALGGAGGGGAGSPGGNGGHNATGTAVERAGLPGVGPGAGRASDYVMGGPGGGGGGAGNAVPGSAGGDGLCRTRCGNPPQTGGAGGAAYEAIDSTGVFLGGSGGGGGAFGTSDNARGAAGGGGGGAVLIVAPEIRITGTVRARGGDGGDGGGTGGYNCDGGGGGGGSGGTVWLRASRVTIGGTIDVAGGTGGATAIGGSAALPGAGGNGAAGTIRIDALELTGAPAGATTTTEVVCDDAPCG